VDRIRRYPVLLGQCGAASLVLDHDPVPRLEVGTGRGLEHDLQALLDDGSLNRPVEVERFTDGSSGRRRSG
jgi:hypothetical protein